MAYLYADRPVDTETTGSGTEVRSYVSQHLADNVENLTLLDAGSDTQDFENFAAGGIDSGENDWRHSSPTVHDDEIVILPDGNHVFRMSSDPASGDFGGPYSPDFGVAAGESSTTAEGNVHILEFVFKSVSDTADGSRLEVDFGNQAGTNRNNFMVIENFAGGIRIGVAEPDADGDFGPSGTAPNDFRTVVDHLDPTEQHKVELRLTYADGPDNDVIEIFVDGHKVGETSTFENYNDAVGGTHEGNAEANLTNAIFFRGGSNGQPQDGPGGQNQGFYFDDITNTITRDADGTGNDVDNAITGNSGNNVLAGLGGNDRIDGGGGTDTASYTVSLAAADVVYDRGTNSWTVHAGAEGTDTLRDIEVVESGSGRILLVGGDGFASIQAAIDAARDGDTIMVADGTFDEDLTIDKAVRILGNHAGDPGTDGSRDAAAGDGETSIIGHAHITAAGAVTIDGVRFLNDVTTTHGGPSNPVLYVGTAFDHVITNSIFYSTVNGGANGVDDRAIMVPALSGDDVTITISGNLISGSQHGAFSDASWGRGIWSDGGDGITLDISGNTIEYSRTGINTDMGGSNAVQIEGNTLNTDGTGIATGVDADGLTIGDNTFHNVGTDFNFRNLTSSVTFDAQAAIEALKLTGVSGQDAVVVLAGSGADTIKGTAGADFLDGNNHPSQGAAADADDIDGRGGDDVIYGRGGNDTLKGGEGSDNIDGGDGNDTVTGGSGSDNLEGGAGTDTAVFEHDIKEYAINLGPNGTYAVTRGGDTDLVHGFENFRFGSGPVIDIIGHADQLSNTHSPVFSSGATASVDENKPAPTVVYDANATDADAAFGKIIYTLGGADALLLNIDSATGEVRLNAPNNFEAKSSYSFNVIATQEGTTQSTAQAVTLSVNDLPEAPIGGLSAGINIEAGLRQASLTPLGLTGAVDPDGDPLTYEVTALPTSGTLFVNGAQVHAHDVLTAAQFAALAYSSPETAGTGTLAFDAFDGTNHTAVSVNLNVGPGLSQVYSGDAGNNRLDGGAGNDVIDGRAGADVMIGGTGNDVFIVDNAGDVVDESGGNGIDLVRSSVSFSLAATHALGSVEQLMLTGRLAVSGFGNALDNTITGNSAANTLTGGAGNDVLIGNAGNDRLSGDAGKDVLHGGVGNDVLEGGTGNDTLYGGAGRDFFDFTVKPSSVNADKIADFRAADDTVGLDNAVMRGLGREGALSADKFYVGAHAHDASDRVIYDSAHGKLLYDGNGSAAGGEVLIATLGTGLHMTYHDIFVI